MIMSTHTSTDRTPRSTLVTRALDRLAPDFDILDLGLSDREMRADLYHGRVDAPEERPAPDRP